jgi:hypothetical protein
VLNIPSLKAKKLRKLPREKSTLRTLKEVRQQYPPVFFTTLLYHAVGWSSRGGAVAEKVWCSAPRGVLCLAARHYNGCIQTIGSS